MAEDVVECGKVFLMNQLFPQSPFPAGNYMFKVNNRNTRARCEISFWCLYC